MRWWSTRSYAVKVYVRAALLECVHANFTTEPDTPSALDADDKLALCDEH